MAPVNEVSPDMLSALSKLHWACGGDWSASITPQECRAILHQLGIKSTITTAFAKDEKPKPYQGDPGDEHQP